QAAATVLAPALLRQWRPGGVALRGGERLGIGSLVDEPIRDMLGIAPLPGGYRNSLAGCGTYQAIDPAGEARPVECGGVFFLDPLDGAALHKEALDRVERGEFVVARLQRSDLGSNAEQLADEILEMGGQLDDEVGLGLMLDRVRIASRRHQPVVQRDVALSEMSDERLVEPNEAVAVVKIREGEPVLEGEIGHRGSEIHAAGGGSIPPISICGYANLNRESDEHSPRQRCPRRDVSAQHEIGYVGPEIKWRAVTRHGIVTVRLQAY